jgi:hypothetical protein
MVGWSSGQCAPDHRKDSTTVKQHVLDILTIAYHGILGNNSMHNSPMFT